MGADEEGTHRRLTALRSEILEPTIRAHHVRTVKNTGDGFLAEFASVVDAVRCAVAIQSAVERRNAGQPRRIQFRIGINLGDVIVEPGDLYGDGVNIAARLEGIASPGGICISRAALEQVRGTVNIQARELGAQRLKNIAQPVHAFTIAPAGPAPATGAAVFGRKATSAEGSRRRWRRGATVAGVLLTAAMAGAAWHGRAPGPPRPATPVTVADPDAPPSARVAGAEALAPPRLSVVVLPFANRSGDPEQDYLAEAITDDLTTLLGRLPLTFVIGRGTAAAYEGRVVDARQLGRELGVRYAVEGSIRRLGERVHVDARILDTATGALLWAESLEEPRAELPEVSRTILARIAKATDTQLLAAEGRRIAQERRRDAEAVDLVLRGRAMMVGTARTAERIEEARGLFERAVALDDGSPIAHGSLALNRPCCMDQRVDAVSLSSPGVMPRGRTPGARARASGSARRRRRPPRSPAAHPCASAAHCRSPV